MTKGATIQATNTGGTSNEADLGLPIVASNSSDTVLTFLNSARKQNKSQEICFYLGAMLQSQGRHQEAVTHYQKAIDLGLKNVALYSNLGLALSDSGQFKKAAETLRLALRIDPDFVSARQNLGFVMQTMGRLDEAKANYRQVLAVQPDHVVVLANLSEVLRAQGALDEAEECINRALAVQPDHVGLILNLGVLLQTKKRFVEAEDCFKRILSIDPENINAHNNLGAAMYAQGQMDEAKASYLRALSIDPENANAHNNIGGMMLDQGHLPEAEESYRRAITFKPDFAKAHFHYVQAKKITHGDEMFIAHLESLAGHPELGTEEKSDVYFALGKCYDDLGKYEQAFLHYENGHRLERQKYSFDPIRHVNEVSSLIATFDQEFFSQRAAYGSSSEVPIFIVGMPRSGTTLVEQIISSHPDVFGAGELYFLDDRRNELSLDSIKQLGPQEVISLADEYVAHLRSFSSIASHVTDKMPQNFFHLGLVRLCFPHARIIHCKRNPLDTCLSIYTQKFATAHPYANDLENMALYYAQYERLMQHWHEVMPDQLFEVQYEDLVADQGTMSRKILEFCNMEWDEKCLAFDRNERVVHTASSWQVRQPMYSTSIGRWRHYQSFLEPLMRLDR
jgi:tetratricopeptide (TPR) repeat protein